MISFKTEEKIDFRPLKIEDKPLYEAAMAKEVGRGCEFSFTNVYLWGRQNIATVGENIVFFSQFSRRTVYPFPIGGGDKRCALDAIIADSRARGIPCRITGVLPPERKMIEEYYPEKFRFHQDEGAFDYVYRVDDLADLQGKKYHSKKNHLNTFRRENPDYTVEKITSANIREVSEFLDEWYEKRISENPNSDFHMEKAALAKALREYTELGIIGLLIRIGGRVIAFTMGSKLSENIIDVHFEKADSEVSGAYAAINYEFANFIRENYPEIEFLDREEDMGLEGLRRAKQSYRPAYQVEKCWACLLEDGYEY